ncbi:phosphoric ester hydrolase, putative [Paecilomyces variotii No. 5]|uniref:Phosphoric ester hydrolase, putative n=1 Tax=Byssochlamys spectabilis (strain No. 5 / NBRC 109023) TaxID=1356009 RepID=V5F9M0_BYSSN|nr:phosphoric ester hydrolase, putative [Paecilomyces variotii No. 5]
MSSPFDPRPRLDYLLTSPLATILHPVHQLFLRLRGPPRLPPPHTKPIRVVCLSDTHSLEWQDVPEGDLLIHAGDLCNDGSVREIQAAVDWLKQLPHPQKVVICGNHDSYFDLRSRRDEDRDRSLSSISSSSASIRSIDDPDSSRIDWGDIHYLQHSAVTVSFPASTSSASSSSSRSRSLTIYGAPQIPAIVPFGAEHAFTYPAKHDAWSGTVPIETDILVTHTPPAFHCDLSPVFSTGCPYLLSEAWRVRPALHVFGHVHAAHGQEPVYWDEAQRAWERLCARRRPWGYSIWGLIRDMLDVRGWLDAARVIGYGIVGVIWSRVWGGENRGCGWMVNAACMYENTGRLGNKPQVIEL